MGGVVAVPNSERRQRSGGTGAPDPCPDGLERAAPGPAAVRRGPARYDHDVLVVGAGIVGLSTAYALTRARPGIRVAVLEKEGGPARHQTGRNSGVIHSGIYYRPGSLKARFAVQGAQEMVKFCAEHGLPHEVTGKLIVATERAELPRLHALAQRGRENGIPVRELGPAQITEYEPWVRGIAAIRVGTTGVCDFRAVADRLAELVTTAGAELRYGAGVTAVDRREGVGVAVRLSDGSVLRARALVNCAGLFADRLAMLAGDDPAARIVPFRGEYYELAEERAELVRGLVYPVPDPAFPFLGVHLTRGIDGGVHLGPNAVPAAAREGYDWRTASAADLARTLAWPGVWQLARRHWRYGAGEIHRSLSRAAFTRAVGRLLPAIRTEDLRPAPAGVRAQAVLRDGTLVDDFLISEAPHTVHVLNAPSPAATASLPIGREVASRVLAGL
ncbi:L-2-hydroxyglutarate oxidase [Streptomyces sp. OF8]|uniref:L-2-hydroxyglutarate oxidase n=1 Tax=Streptomyces alkaliterrae TaxID=2213162 RepID=A0A5P0YUF3_9ACTN|nr:L-2-hydroxyglutarate oxidase [Streptomyces alkaliterrae]MQS03941.1 L-2-hydroxyglutarate oxidase [Streptomyces alkaliterrae]